MNQFIYIYCCDNNRSEVMGCIPQNGLLGPKKSHKEVYVEIIEIMHQEIIVHFDNFQAEITYQNIKEVLISKGLIKKLSDNLLSHKAKISDCLSYCSKRLEGVDIKDEHIYTGLVIITEVLVRIDNENSQDKQRTSKHQKQSFDQKAATLSTQALQMSKNYDEPLMSVNNEQKIERQYLKFILAIISKEKIVYEMILEAIITYCKNKKQKFNSKQQIHKILNYIIENLYMNHLLEMSCVAYLYLLNKLKEGGKDDLINEKVLYHFIILWSKAIQRIENAKCLSYYESIIKILFERGLANWDYRLLYRSIFSIYDVYLFQENQVIQMEQLFFKIIKDNDVNNQIKKGYLQYLFEYLSYNKVEESYDLFSQEYKTKRYQNIYREQTKLNGLKSIRRLQYKCYIDINSYIELCRFMLIRVYISNIFFYKDMDQEIIKEFREFILLLNHSSNINILDILIEELISSKPLQRANIFQLIHQVLDIPHLFSEQLPQTQHLFKPIDLEFTPQQKQEYINILLLIFKSIDFSLFKAQNYQNNNLISNIYSFLYNLYESLKEHSEHNINSVKEREIEQKQRENDWSKVIYEFMRLMWQKKTFNILIAYLENIRLDILSINKETSCHHPTLSICIHLYQKGLALFDQSTQIDIEQPEQISCMDESNLIKNLSEELIDDGENKQQLRGLMRIKKKFILNNEDFNKILQSFSALFDRLRLKSQQRQRYPQLSTHKSFYASISEYRQKSLAQIQNSFKVIMHQIHDY